MSTLRNVGLAFFLSGVLILLGYGAVKVMVVPKTPFLIRLGFLAILIGVAILLISLIQEQYKEDDAGVNRKY